MFRPDAEHGREGLGALFVIMLRLGVHKDRRFIDKSRYKQVVYAAIRQRKVPFVTIGTDGRSPA